MIHVLPRIFESDEPAPDQIHGYISVRGTESVFDVGARVAMASSKPYHGKKEDRAKVRRSLEKSGFLVIGESPLGFAVVAPAAAYEDISGGTIALCECLTEVAPGALRYVTRIDLVGNNQPQALGLGAASSKAAKIDGIVIEKPVYTHGPRLAAGPSPFPPSSPKFHLGVPNDVAMALNASPLHAQGIRGDNVLVAMVDTGFYKHPFFLAQGYRLKPALRMVPGTSAGRDPIGHGTGESANIFAGAPGIVFQGIRASNAQGDLVAAQGGFLAAKGLQPKPQIISCSWGGNYPFPPPPEPDASDAAFALEITQAIEEGIVVVFSAGNGHFGPEPQVPGVIAAGGVFMAPTGALQASDYASGYESPWFGGVRVPTVCGLVGLLPRAQYLMLPVPKGCELDVSESRDEPDEVGDSTTERDGWALFSGTSAAAPQLAGIAALILGAKPNLTPAQVAESMVETAVDVVAGTCNPRFGFAAGPGPDVATGPGLVNAEAAVAYAQSRF